MELTEAHLRLLQTLLAGGFTPVSFPLFPNFVGIQKYGCAALLRLVGQGRLELAAQAGYLLEGNISVVVERGGEKWFVWKSLEVRATPERLGRLRRFEEELTELLERPAVV